MSTEKFTAGATFPDIELPTLDGEYVSLGTPQNSADWRMVVVYRGAHCPLCTRYLRELDSLKDKFLDLGVDVIAVSADSEAQARQHTADLSLDFPIAYGLSIADMQTLGIYISEPRSVQETDHPFAEPALFVINNHGQAQIISVANAAFVRPKLDDMVDGIAFIRDPEQNYPIRGTYA